MKQFIGALVLSLLLSSCASTKITGRIVLHGSFALDAHSTHVRGTPDASGLYEASVPAWYAANLAFNEFLQWGFEYCHEEHGKWCWLIPAPIAVWRIGLAAENYNDN